MTHLRPSMVSISLALVSISLGPLACKPAAESQTPVEAPSPAAASTPVVRVPAEALPPPPVVVYGYFRVPAASRLLEQVAVQLVPAAQRSVLNEAMLRSMIGMNLGERAKVVEHVDLTRPMGCVVSSPKQHDRPLACVVAYTGGLAQLVEDLGPNGYVSGMDGFASYRFEGQPVYLTAMGEHVAFAFGPTLTAASRELLEREIIGAPAGAEDFTATVYPDVIFEDAKDEIDGMLAQMQSATQAAGPNQELAIAAQRKQWMSYAELERAELWMDLAPERVQLGYRGTARAGTPTHEAYAMQREAHQDRELLAQLPSGAFLTGGMVFDAASLAADPLFGAYVQSLSSLDASGATAAFSDVYRESMALWSTISTGHAAMAMLHEKGTKGGVVVAYRLKSDADARPQLLELFERYETIARDGPIPFDVSIRRGGLRVGKVRGDIVTMKPTAAVQAELAASPGWAELTKALGGPPTLHMAYAQQGDVLYLAMAPQKVERYLRRALSAAASTKPVGARKAELAVPESRLDGTMLIATNVQVMLDWLVAIDAIEPRKGTIGGRADDVVMTIRPGEAGQREVIFEVSQSFIDSLLVPSALEQRAQLDFRF